MKAHQKVLACQLCGKTSQSSFNRPKSLHKTHRLVHPNVQKWNGYIICNRCRRTLTQKLASVAKTA